MLSIIEGLHANADGRTTAEYHQLGTRVGDSAWAASSNKGPGFLTYGPYTTEYQNGAFRASFELSLDNNIADDLVVAFVDVYDDLSKKEIARREIHRKEFEESQTYKSFDLTFVTLGPNELEFRVYVFGVAYVAHRTTTLVQLSSLALGVPVPASAPTNRHQLGSEGTNLSWISVPSLGQGYLTTQLSGSLTPGNYVAEFFLKIGGTRAPDPSAVTLDVFDLRTSTVLAARRVADRLRDNSQIRPLVLPFYYDGVGDVELRVHVAGDREVQHFSSTVSPALPLYFDGANRALSHQFGTAKGTAWVGDTGSQRGMLTYGPKAETVPPGFATAIFNLTAIRMQAGADSVATLEVYDATASKVIARRLIRRQDFQSITQEFDLVFELAAPTSLEFRVFATGVCRLQHNSTVIIPDRLSLSSLWNQHAHFEFRQRDYFLHGGIHDGATGSLAALDGVWYAFNRAAAAGVTQKQGAPCNASNRPPLQVVVRKSSDHGITWSDPVIAIPPASRMSAPDTCEVVDGGAFYDGETDSWHYLGQCIGVSGNWNMCHYVRHGSSPLGLFDVDASNPVVLGGTLWSQICEGQAKKCPIGMRDEGTPQIVLKDSGGYFYVTFHGALYGSTVTGARGIARTSDFQHWQVSGQNLPDDAILSKVDCDLWAANWASGGCIGEGAARILRSGDRYYQISEAADSSLLCQPGQQWVFGLSRSFDIAASGAWENYSANPFVVNKNLSPDGCALQYMNLFRDRGEIYLEFSLYTPDYAYPNYTYQLVDGGGSSAIRTN